VETEGEMIKEMVERDFWVGEGFSGKCLVRDCWGKCWFEQEMGGLEQWWVRMMHLKSKIFFNIESVEKSTC